MSMLMLPRVLMAVGMVAAMMPSAVALGRADLLVRQAAGCVADDRAPGVTRPSGRSATRLRVNIPAFRLDVLDGDRVVQRYPVAVGTKRYPTPARRFVVSSVVWNPWWIPPGSDWARRDTVTPPGPANPMGRVKINLGEPYFVHGTPDSASVGHARSHGCMRMRQEDAVALARLVMAAGGVAGADSIADAALAGRNTIEIALTDSVVAETVYALAEVRGDSLFLYRDVYGRGPAWRAAAARALYEAGRDTASLALERLPRRLAASPTVVLIPSLARAP